MASGPIAMLDENGPIASSVHYAESGSSVFPVMDIGMDGTQWVLAAAHS
jgi:hypothetical protein